MGFGDRFKDLTKQAKDAVAEHKEELHNAVDVVSAAADQKTRGKYADKIAKFSQKAANAVDRTAADGTEPDGTEPEEPPAPEAQAAQSAPAPTGPPPSFDE